MPVSDSQAANASFSEETLRTGEFNVGTDSGDTIQQGNVGEVATAEVGETGKLSNAIALILGVPVSVEDQSPRGRVKIQLYDGAGNQVGGNAQIKFVKREKGERGGVDITGWMDLDDLDWSDPVKGSRLQPRKEALKDGQILALHVRDESENVTVDFSSTNTTTKIPVQKGT